MSVHIRKKHENVCKANTLGDAPMKSFVFRNKVTLIYRNTTPIALT